MCRPGGRHFTGSSKRVEAFSKSSNLVVNSVALSRDLPVFTGFFEIIRVVKWKSELLNGKLLNVLKVYDIVIKNTCWEEIVSIACKKAIDIKK